MRFRDVMDLPLRTFWSLNRNVDRLRAEEEFRHLQVAAAAASAGDGVKTLGEALRGEIGNPTIIEKGFDSAKFAELQEKLRQPGVPTDTHTE